MQYTIGVQMHKLKLIVVENTSEEVGGGHCQPPLHKVREHHGLTWMFSNCHAFGNAGRHSRISFGCRSFALTNACTASSFITECCHVAPGGGIAFWFVDPTFD